jgi:hypothetical protein
MLRDIDSLDASLLRRCQNLLVRLVAASVRKNVQLNNVHTTRQCSPNLANAINDDPSLIVPPAPLAQPSRSFHTRILDAGNEHSVDS